jgi:UDP:flavonoid glycosyltransferase YjiC (YdhE family)
MTSERPIRLLVVSGSVGLGHAARDLAIAAELRRLAPGIDIGWLAADPGRTLIAEAGERILPEAAALAEETASAEKAAAGFGMDIVKYLVQARDAWRQTVDVYRRVVERQAFDAVVGDETYEIGVALKRHPELRWAPFTMLYDFVGLDARTRSPFERVMVHVWNRTWCGGARGRPPAADQTLFLGELEDIPDRPFGYRLPNRREYARRYYESVGYVLPFDPEDYRDRAAVRAALGYDERPLIICAVGGTAVGAELLELCRAAQPHVRERVPDARMVLVCGPRVNPSQIRASADVEVRGYVPRLYEHLAACDVAIVQGGGTTTLELTALRRPFAYFPLEGHSEQEIAVAGRLERQRAGERLRFSATRPESLADAVVRLLGSEPDWDVIRTDGARRAAERILASCAEPRPMPPRAAAR